MQSQIASKLPRDMNDFRSRYIADVSEQFVKDSAEHVVEQRHSAGDVVRYWRCGKPDSSIYHFNIYAAPGYLIVTGDMGECIWSRTEDMIGWARSACRSLDYFSEKVPNRVQIEEEKHELIDEWFRSIKSEWTENGREWTAEQDEALQSIRDDYQIYEDPREFRRALYESCLCNDCEDIPKTKFYTYHYLWLVEGIKWFIAKLDDPEHVQRDFAVKLQEILKATGFEIVTLEELREHLDNPLIDP